MENWTNRIALDPDICDGKPTVRGTRITVQTILGFLAAGDSVEEVMAAYPSLNAEDIRAALMFASSLMDRGFTIKSVA